MTYEEGMFYATIILAIFAGISAFISVLAKREARSFAKDASRSADAAEKSAAEAARGNEIAEEALQLQKSQHEENAKLRLEYDVEYDARLSNNPQYRPTKRALPSEAFFIAIIKVHNAGSSSVFIKSIEFGITFQPGQAAECTNIKSQELQKETLRPGDSISRHFRLSHDQVNRLRTVDSIVSIHTSYGNDKIHTHKMEPHHKALLLAKYDSLF